MCPAWSHVRLLMRAIEVLYTAHKEEFRRNPRSCSGGVLFFSPPLWYVSWSFFTELIALLAQPAVYGKPHHIDQQSVGTSFIFVSAVSTADITVATIRCMYQLRLAVTLCLWSKSWSWRGHRKIRLYHHTPNHKKRVAWCNRVKGAYVRRSTIEIHPSFSEAPHLRSSVPYPITDFSKNQIASRWIIPWPTYPITYFFETRLAFRRFWAKEPRHSENMLAEMYYLYRRTLHI